MNTPSLSTTPNELTLVTRIVLNAWEGEVARITKLLDALTDEQLLSETATGRNRGTYLMGHLIVVTDAMQPLLNLGNKLYPALEAIFLTNPDNPTATVPSVTELRSLWKEVHQLVTEKFKTVTPEEWLARHSAVSAEDFVKEPHRNKLNVLISRTNHMSYHRGQLVYLAKK